MQTTLSDRETTSHKAFCSRDCEHEGLLVDFNTGTLRRNHVLFQETPGIELYIGLGPVAGEALEFAFERKFAPGSFLGHCDALDQALEKGALTKSSTTALGSELELFDKPHLRRLILLETMLAKAGVNDPRPGWPAGTPGGLGGKFRPKDTSPEARETTAQALRRLEARKQFRIAASAALQLAGTAALNLLPGAGEVADVEELVALGKTAIELGNAEVEVNSAIDFVKKGPYTLDQLRASPDDESFSSFDAFKKTSLALEALLKAFGSAGPGNEYHHVVEQGGDNAINIPPELLHSTKNIFRVPRLLHELVNAEYAKPSVQDPTKSVREWLRTQPFDVQYEEGIKILKKLGIVKGEAP